MAWEQTPDSYRLPTVRLDVEDVGWLTGAAVGSWSLERELVASTIPGSIRQRSGLSIGTGSVTVRPAATVTPWSIDAANRVTSGVPATVYVEDSAGDTLPLGAWVTDGGSGSLSSAGVEVPLIEAQYAGRKKPQALEPYWGPIFSEDAPVDPSWILGRLLDQAGFPAVPPPVPSALLAAPLYGAVGPLATELYPISPYLSAGYYPNGLQVLDGDVAVGMGNGSGAIYSANVSLGQVRLITDRFIAFSSPIYLTLNVVGQVDILDAAGGWQIRIVNNHDTGTYTLGVSNTGTGIVDTVTFVGQQSADWPNRVQISMTRTVDPDEANPLAFTATAFKARIRSADTALFSSEAVDLAPFTPSLVGMELINISAGIENLDAGIDGLTPGQFAAVQFSTSADADLWTPSKTHLQPLDADAGLPMVPPGLDTWTAVQDCASAYNAAVVIDRDGIAQVLTRDDLAGVGTTGTATDVGAEWADLSWDVDPDDTADRLEVTYNAPTITETDYAATVLAPEVWRAADIITVPAGETIEIKAAFETRAAVGLFTGFLIPITPSTLWAKASTIIAFDNPAGTGTQLDFTSFQPTAVQTSATTATVKVKNLTAAPIYLVDGNGEAALILRAAKVASFETPRTVTRGVAAEDAEQPLAVDLSTWVQSEAEAAEVADYLWSRVSGGGLWKASSVRVRLDWRHDIGRVLAVTHPGTGLTSKVLTTKVSYDGEPGEITQTLDLALLPPTWADWDAITSTPGYLNPWSDFDAAYAGRTWADFDLDPLWIGA